ncbi:MAG: hypothetical protein AAFN74_25765, partial [Myxococcota bacterium]
MNFSGGRASGGCEQDCLTSADCEQPASSASRAICTNEGRCRVEARPTRLVVVEPEPEAQYTEGTEAVRITGEIEMASPEATIVVTTGEQGCGAGISSQVTVRNETGGFAAVPFILDNVFVDPGQTMLDVSASTPGSTKTLNVPISVACPGCAQVTVTSPLPNSTGDGLRLPVLQGQVDTRIQSAIWRVRGPGGLLDGTLPVDDSGRSFALADLPLFPGVNRVEVLVTGVGQGRGERRCSVRVNAGVSAESG